MKRKTEISLLNVFLCMLVIFIHVSSVPVSSLLKNSWQYGAVLVPWRLSAFAVQGFIFLSALKLFINHSEKISYGKFYLSRLTKIVLPYLLWVLIYDIYFVSNGYFSFSFTDLLNDCLVGNLVSHFYFIIIIVQFYLLVPLWRLMVKKADCMIALIVSVMLTLILGQHLPEIISLFLRDFSFAYNDRIFTTYLLYWVAGCYAGLYYEKFKEILVNQRGLISVLFVCAAAGDAVLSRLSFSGKIFIGWLENLHVLYCICAILFFFSIALMFSEKKAAGSRFVQLFDRSSYNIYLVHPLIIFIVNGMLACAGITSIFTGYMIRIAVTYTAAISLCMLWSCIKNKVSVRKVKQR